MRDIKPSGNKFTGKQVPVSNIPVEPAEDNMRPFARTGLTEKEMPKPKKMVPKDASEIVAKKKRAPNMPTLGSRERSIFMILIIIAIILALIAAYVFLPRANVALLLKTSPLLVDQQVEIGTNSTTKNAVDGSSFFRELELDGNIKVTGKETIGQKASGTVNLVNRTVEKQQIVSGSRLVTEDGVLFFTQDRVDVPAGSGGTLGQATVKVEADLAGESGNVASGQLNFAAFDEASQKLVYAEARQGITGGTGEVVSVVTPEDLAAAEKHAQTQAQGKVEAEIRAELPGGWVILDESWQADFLEFSVDAKEGDRTPEMSYQARIKLDVIGYEQAALEEKVRQALDEQLEGDVVLFPGPISFNKQVDELNLDQGSATIGVRVTHTTIPDISLDSLRGKVAGRSHAEAQAYLEGITGVSGATIKMWPGFFKTMPRLSNRIDLELTPERQP